MNFLEISHENLKNKIIVGNIYKPPEHNNSSVNVKGFVSQLELLLRDLSNANSEVLICGDYNINLLKVNFEPHFSDFFDTMLAHSFFPKITFPTRVNNSSGATLMDNIFCELAPIALQIKFGILLDEISDHYSYFISFDICHNPNKLPKLVKKHVNNAKAIQDMVTDMKYCDILKIIWKNIQTQT